jgi:hypothetical protein
MSRRDSHQPDGLVGDQTLHPAGKLREFDPIGGAGLAQSAGHVHADGLLITSSWAISP